MTRPLPVPRFVLVRVLLRSLWLQASFEPAGMQGLGFGWAIFPALTHLYPDPSARREALRRHLTPFNCHPYAAAAVIGGVIALEAEVARGTRPSEEVVAFKQALMGPLAAIGDSFFWLALRPFAGALAAVLAPFIGLLAVPLFLLLFDLPHVLLRATWLVRGARLGEAVLAAVGAAGLPRKAMRLRDVTAVLGGAALPMAALALLADAEGRPHAGLHLLEHGAPAPLAWALIAAAAAAAGGAALAGRGWIVPFALTLLALGLLFGGS